MLLVALVPAGIAVALFVSTLRLDAVRSQRVAVRCR
jgi:hypothetical protein